MWRRHKFLKANEPMATIVLTRVFPVNPHTSLPILGRPIDCPIRELTVTESMNTRANYRPRVSNHVDDPRIRKASSNVIEPENVCRRFLAPTAFAISRCQRAHDDVHNICIGLSLRKSTLKMPIRQQIPVRRLLGDDGIPISNEPVKFKPVRKATKPFPRDKCLRFTVNPKLRVHIESQLYWRRP
jgi:hypothetical protein